VPEGTLLRHEWEIAVALRDITDLRAEHGMNMVASVGPMTNAVLKAPASVRRVPLTATGKTRSGSPQPWNSRYFPMMEGLERPFEVSRD
jgi:hypothetical protein